MSIALFGTKVGDPDWVIVAPSATAFEAARQRILAHRMQRKEFLGGLDPSSLSGISFAMVSTMDELGQHDPRRIAFYVADEFSLSTELAQAVAALKEQGAMYFTMS